MHCRKTKNHKKCQRNKIQEKLILKVGTIFDFYVSKNRKANYMTASKMLKNKYHVQYVQFMTCTIRKKEREAGKCMLILLYTAHILINCLDGQHGYKLTAILNKYIIINYK